MVLVTGCWLTSLSALFLSGLTCWGPDCYRGCWWRKQPRDPRVHRGKEGPRLRSRGGCRAQLSFIHNTLDASFVSPPEMVSCLSLFFLPPCLWLPVGLALKALRKLQESLRLVSRTGVKCCRPHGVRRGDKLSWEKPAGSRRKNAGWHISVTREHEEDPNGALWLPKSLPTMLNRSKALSRMIQPPGLERRKPLCLRPLPFLPCESQRLCPFLCHQSQRPLPSYTAKQNRSD